MDWLTICGSSARSKLFGEATIFHTPESSGPLKKKYFVPVSGASGLHLPALTGVPFPSAASRSGSAKSPHFTA